MTHIKKLTIHGFKSFAKATEVIFDKGLNVIAGPNGSGKSNIPDAICFVLGRLSIKSMRASRASKLIFHGGKEGKPAQFAKVSMTFDNSNKEFSLDKQEVEISRIVKRDGNSIYKINDETKTRQEVLELLGQAGIDPDGFNIILQGQIDSLIRMPPDEKRQIIEEISGILVYEQRKEKSLRELEKTESELKEVGTILNERKAYLANLEKEREQALKYEQLQKDIKRCKGSIINKKMDSVKKDIERINKDVQEKEKHIEKLKNVCDELRKKVQTNNEGIIKIEEEIEKKTGIEQEQSRNKILELKTDSARLNMNKEHVKDQLNNLEIKERGNNQEIERLKNEIKELESKSSIKITTSEKARYESVNQEIDNVKKKLDEIELKKERNNLNKNEISRKQALLDERIKQISQIKERINMIEKELESSPKLKKTDENIKDKREEHQKNLEMSQIKIKELEREIIKLVTKRDIEKRDVEEILKLSQCPKCKQVVSKEHKENLIKQIKNVLKEIEKDIEDKNKSKKQIESEIDKISLSIKNFIEKQQELEKFFYQEQEENRKRVELERLKNNGSDLEAHASALKEEIENIKKDIYNYDDLIKKGAEFNDKLEKLREELIKIRLKKPFELTERDVNIEIELKRREIEQVERNMKQAKKESMELGLKFKELNKEYEIKTKELEKKEQEQEIIEKKFKRLLEEKSKFQKEIHEFELSINEKQFNKNTVEGELNEIKIEKARIGASLSSLEIEFQEFSGLELFDKSLNELESKLVRYEEQFRELGNVNLRALEVYDKIKEEYDHINEKVLKLEEEKTEILKIIAEIDKKKKKSFMQTLDQINESFVKNFSMLSKKGTAFLELENKDNPFDGGLNILIKLGKGKYMESELLSGGEKVIVALALIFAIQKYRPYSFYIFDEIDAALDKVNSEILANLIKENIKNSQYLMVSHNDVVISNADILYGTSMQEGITKVFSLRV
jgi:chromosome segregation protein